MCPAVKSPYTHDQFEHNFLGLSPILRSYAFNLTRDSVDASDLYQETAIRAFMYRDKFSPGTNLKAWLFTIMKNVFINDYRQKNKRHAVLDATINLYYLNSGSLTNRNEGESNILNRELWHMIGSLGDHLRIPFLMHFKGYKYQEIADELGLALGTVKSRIFFARKALKQKIREMYGDRWELTN